MSIAEILGRNISYPLWDLKDGSERLREWRSLEASQWWQPEQLRELQLSRLQSVVAHALESVPYYRARLEGLSEIRRFEDLSLLPILRKADVRRFSEQLVSQSIPADQLLEAKTGGSTGVSLTLKFDVRCQEWRNGAAMRSDRWAGWQPGMLVAALWGTPPVPRTLKEKVRNALHDRLFFLDTMNLNEESMGRFAEVLERRRPGGLFGHSHSLFVFSRFIDENSIKVPALRSIVATSMMLLESERKLIEKVFKCAVTNRYGCEEVGLIACECDRHEGLHVNSEHVVVELLRPDGTPVGPGEEGEVVVTDLINKGMPLIRYAIEDVAVWSDEPCACGRSSPRLKKVVGRVADFLIRRDGSLVAGVSLVEKTLTAISGLEQLQIVQDEIARFTLNVVPSQSFSAASRLELERVIYDVFGKDIDLQTRTMDRLPQERNSKYRFAVCRVERRAGL